jgi:hypothetical protein
MIPWNSSRSGANGGSWSYHEPPSESLSFPIRTSLTCHKNPVWLSRGPHPLTINILIISTIITGWWLSHPSEKYESQLGWWFLIWKIKKSSKPPTRSFIVVIATISQAILDYRLLLILVRMILCIVIVKKKMPINHQRSLIPVIIIMNKKSRLSINRLSISQNWHNHQHNN